MSIDLHLHSENSDGTDSPETIIEKAIEIQLEAISITDHEYLTKVPVSQHIEIISGVEVSVSWEKLEKSNPFAGIHLLLYFVKEESIPKLGKHWASGIGSFDKQHILNHKSKRFEIQDHDIDNIEIDFITFENLIKEYEIESIDNLQIDVEGAEYEILNSIDFKKIRINSIQLNNPYPEIKIDTSKFKETNQDLLIKGKKIAFGIDSFEDYKIWHEENFVELANLLYEKKIFDHVYLICGPEKSYLADNIKKLSKKNYFIDCCQKDLTGIILALKNSHFFVGNNSGPMNIAAALGVKSFGLICNDPVSELKYSNILKITPDNYDENILKRDRNDMKKLTVEKVSNFILKKIK